MYGDLVPRSYAQSFELDKESIKTKWQDSETLEMLQLTKYQAFIDKSKGGQLPTGYKCILCHMAYDVKHDGRH